MIEDANKDDDLEIIVDDAPAGEGGSADIQIEQPNKPNEAGVEDWKAQFEAAQKKADEAERVAKQRAEELDRVQRENSANRTAVVSAEMMAIESAIANAEHERSDAEDEYAQAMEVGDFKAAAKAQSKISDIAVRSRDLVKGKAEIERRAEEAKNPTRQAPDPIDQYTQGMTPASANWVRSHADMFLNDAKRSYVIAAHHKAVERGIGLDTPEYFDFIERDLGLRSDGNHQLETEQRQTRTAAPAAPVSRGGAVDAPRTSQNTIRLTAAQREMARECGMTDLEYARELQKIERERSTTH